MNSNEAMNIIVEKEEERIQAKKKFLKEDLIIRNEIIRLKELILIDKSNYWYFDAAALCFVQYEQKDMGSGYIGPSVYGPVNDNYRNEGNYLWVTAYNASLNSESLSLKSILNSYGLFKERDDAIEDSFSRIKLFRSGVKIECSPVIQK